MNPATIFFRISHIADANRHCAAEPDGYADHIRNELATFLRNEST